MKAIVREHLSLSIPSLPSCFKRSTGSTVVQCSVGCRLERPDCIHKRYTADSAFLKRSKTWTVKKRLYTKIQRLWCLLFSSALKGSVEMKESVDWVTYSQVTFVNIVCIYFNGTIQTIGLSSLLDLCPSKCAGTFIWFAAWSWICGFLLIACRMESEETF